MNVLFKTPKIRKSMTHQSQRKVLLFCSELPRFVLLKSENLEQAIKANLRGLGYGR